MTTDLNVEMYRALARIADDESLMKQAVDFVKSLVKTKKKADPTLMTKEEYFAKIDRSLEQAKRGEVKVFTNKEDMNAWLNSL
ncbi:MAG: hypothetical protein IJ150_09285 [Bacteroidales bacterium]|nr:hypothetical protein [Bacteroidales bacterium]